MSRRTRARHLARMAQRRQMERRRQRRRKTTIIVSAFVVAALGLGLAGWAFLRGGGRPATAASGTPTSSASPSGPPGTKTGMVTPKPGPTAVACGAKAPKDALTPKPQFGSPAQVLKKGSTYTATMQTSCGTIVIELDPKLAPQTVNSLVFLASQHFFDGTRFHRIARNFVIQGGDPAGTGSGGPGYSTLDAPPASAKYPIGTVAMAKAPSDPAGTAGSQFFIVTSSSAQSALAPGGSGQYAIVGHVVSGMDVVGKIAALPIQGGGTDGPPAQAVYIDNLAIKASKS